MSTRIAPILCLLLLVFSSGCSVFQPREVDRRDILKALSGAQGGWVDSCRDGGSVIITVHGKGPSMDFFFPIPKTGNQTAAPRQRMRVNWMKANRGFENDFIDDKEVVSELKRVLEQRPIRGQSLYLALVNRAFEGRSMWRSGPQGFPDWEAVPIRDAEVRRLARSKAKQFEKASRENANLLVPGPDKMVRFNSKEAMWPYPTF